MDAWANAAQSANPRPAKRGRGAASSGGADVEKLLVLVAKLGLKNAQDMRAVQATVFKTVMLDRDSSVAELALEAIKVYMERAKAQAQEYPPSTAVWEAVTRAAAAVPALEQAHKDTIAQHRAQVTDPAMLASTVTHCRTAKAFDKKKVKLHMAVHASVEPVMCAVIRACQLTGGRLLYGQAPKGGLERDIQKMMDQLGHMANDEGAA